MNSVDNGCVRMQKWITAKEQLSDRIPLKNLESPTACVALIHIKFVQQQFVVQSPHQKLDFTAVYYIRNNILQLSTNSKFYSRSDHFWRFISHSAAIT